MTTGVHNIRGDDYVNTLTTLGTSKDKSSSTHYADRPLLTHEQLDSMYEQEALAARIVDRVVDDASREGFEIVGADKSFDYQELQSELESIDVLNQVANAWRWARLYGGALLVMVVNDSQPMDKPMDLRSATKLLSLHTVESTYATPDGFRRGLGARAFGAPDAYNILTPFGDAKLKRVHRSRVIRFDGVRVSTSRLVSRGGWGPSVLDRVCRELRRLGTSMGYAESILHELSAMVLKLKGFREQAAGSDKSKRELKQAFEMMRYSIDNLNTLVLDSEDEYAERPRTVAGLDALLHRFVDALVRATDMPRTVLLGEQPSGLNASADSEIRAWFDHVGSQRPRILTPALTRLLDVILRLRAKSGRPVPEEWTIEYPPLWQPTDKEKADTGMVNAQADNVYLTYGITSPEEVRSRLIREGRLEPAADELPLLPEETELGT